MLRKVTFCFTLCLLACLRAEAQDRSTPEATVRVGRRDEPVVAAELPLEEAAQLLRRALSPYLAMRAGRAFLTRYYDLTQHSKFSGKTLDYFDEETKTRFIPYVVEPAAGADSLAACVSSVVAGFAASLSRNSR